MQLAFSAHMPCSYIDNLLIIISFFYLLFILCSYNKTTENDDDGDDLLANFMERHSEQRTASQAQVAKTQLKLYNYQNNY